ncbi:uncharacterized protein LOC124143576 [Haliotis rufescens]|uniref:uncharacterized protein LOC124143576 n=1 Tax=Haliotis rufescens TaxID=6454 RepID=UPI00201F05B1|nr:uncharacterized protein LOC124143576 [Haliotis rufescens]
MVALRAIVACFLGVHVYKSSGSELGCLHGQVEDNIMAISNVYRVDRGIPLYKCIAHCQMANKCKSISYRKGSMSCALVDTDAPGMHKDEDVVFIKMNSFQKSLAGRCSQLSCESGKKCVVDRLHRPSCVWESTWSSSESSTATSWTTAPTTTVAPKCGSPRKEENAKATVTGYDVGDKAVYVCNPNHIMCGTGTVVCEPTGEWASSEFQCMPDFVTVAERRALSCPLTTESNFIVTRLATSMLSITIEISNHATAQILARLHMSFTEGTIQWSGLTQGKWTDHDKHAITSDGASEISLIIMWSSDLIWLYYNGESSPSMPFVGLGDADVIDVRSSLDTDIIRVSNCCP